MTALTPRQTNAFDFIRSFIDDKGWSPTIAEIAAGIGNSSKGSAHRIVTELAERGAIALVPHRRRSIEIIEQPRAPDGTDFLPDQLAVWVRVIAARAGVSPLEVVAECVRDAYTTRRNREQTVSREASSRPDPVRASA